MRAAYDEIIDFIAAGPTPREIVDIDPPIRRAAVFWN
jgi:hypothetical protein